MPFNHFTNKISVVEHPKPSSFLLPIKSYTHAIKTYFSSVFNQENAEAPSKSLILSEAAVVPEAKNHQTRSLQSKRSSVVSPRYESLREVAKRVAIQQSIADLRQNYLISANDGHTKVPG